MTMTRIFSRATILAAFSLAFLSAADPSHATSEIASWDLLRGNGIEAAEIGMPAVTIEKQRLSGSTGCNSFTAALTKSPDGRVVIAQPGLTRKLCGPTQERIENAFIDALGRTQFVEQKGAQLIFLSGTRQPLLVWQKRQARVDRTTQRQITHRHRVRASIAVVKYRDKLSTAELEHRVHRRAQVVKRSCFIFR